MKTYDGLPILAGGLLMIVLFATLTFAAARPKTSCREKAINETLTMTLLVGSDMRAQGKHPTWGEIEAEVKKRLRVK